MTFRAPPCIFTLVLAKCLDRCGLKDLLITLSPVSMRWPRKIIRKTFNNATSVKLLGECAFLGYYAACRGNFLPTFRVQPIGPIFKHQKSKKFVWKLYSYTDGETKNRSNSFQNRFYSAVAINDVIVAMIVAIFISLTSVVVPLCFTSGCKKLFISIFFPYEGTANRPIREPHGT